jgi:tetratricopeptide (TPR) repeat protein
LGVLGFQRALVLAESEVVAKRGFETSRTVEGYFTGFAELRRALRANPDNPQFNFWMANLLFRRESEKAAREDVAGLELARFQEALEHLRRARLAYKNPSSVLLMSGEAASMLATAHARLGNRALEEEFVAVAAENFYAMRLLGERPAVSDPVSHYNRAIRRLVQAGKPHQALALADDYERLYPAQGPRPAELDAAIASARRQMGEFPMMMNDLSRRALLTPWDIPTLGEIQLLGERAGQAHHALLIFRELQARGELPTEALPVIAQMEQLSARQRSARSAPAPPSSTRDSRPAPR